MIAVVLAQDCRGLVDVAFGRALIRFDHANEPAVVRRRMQDEHDATHHVCRAVALCGEHAVDEHVTYERQHGDYDVRHDQPQPGALGREQITGRARDRKRSVDDRPPEILATDRADCGHDRRQQDEQQQVLTGHVDDDGGRIGRLSTTSCSLPRSIGLTR